MNPLHWQIARVAPRRIGLRQPVHPHPEPTFERQAGRDRVAAWLAGCGCEAQRWLDW